MTELKKALSTLPIKNIKTYVQSGNVVASSSLSAMELKASVESLLLNSFGFEVPVLIRTPEEFKSILGRHPFVNDDTIGQCAVVFMDQEPVSEQISELGSKVYGKEDYKIAGREIYYYAPEGFGKAKMTNNLFESKLKVVATTRNWKTVSALFDMAVEIA